jgi:hypothetical protein
MLSFSIVRSLYFKISSAFFFTFIIIIIIITYLFSVNFQDCVL